MVTIQEIEQREQQLKEAETEAQLYIREPIPQRRFGSGVTPAQQKAVISRRQEAKRVIGEVQQQRTELKDVRQQVIQYESQQSQLAELRRQEDQYQYGYRLGLRGVAPTGLSKQAREGYKTAQGQLQASTERVQRVEQIRKLEAEGIKPLLDDKGVIVGIEDRIRGQSLAVTEKNLRILPKKDIERYERAGLIKVTQEKGGVPQLTPAERLNLIVESKVAERKQSIAPKEYFFERVQRNIEKPFNKIAYLREKQLQKGIKVYNPKIYQEYPEANLQRIELIKERKLKSPENIRTAGRFVSFPFYGAGRVERYLRDPQFREEYARQTNLQKTIGFGTTLLSLGALRSISKSALRYTTKPIKVYETPAIPTKFFADTRLSVFRSGSKNLNVAEFEITGITASRRAFYIPRYTKVLTGIKKADARLLQYTPKQLELMFPRGKFVEIAPTRVTKSITEPFIVRRGRIQSALGRKGAPAVFTGRFNIYQSGKVRFTSKKISSLYGENIGSKSVKTLSKGRDELSEIQKLALERIEQTKIKGVKALPKELDITASAIETKDLLKIQSRGVKPFSPGRTIRRGDIISVQKELLNIQKGTKEFGLKEVTVSGEKLGVVDVSKTLRPRKAQLIEGRTTIKEYELPDLTPSDVKVMAPGSQKTQLKFDNELNQKVIQKAVGTTALNQPKVPTSSTIKPVTRGEVTQTGASPFAGTGLYERTEMEAQRLPAVQKFVQAPGLTPAFSPAISLRPIQIPKTSNLTKSIPKEISKTLPKEIPRLLPKSIPKLMPKEVTKQVPKTIPKQIVKQVPKIIPKLGPGITPLSPITPSKTAPPIKFPKFPSGKSTEAKGVPGFKPFVIKGGEKVFIGGALPKAEALFKAEKEAKTTLRATFGVEQTKTLVSPGKTDYKPSSKLFRSYRIKEGKRIPLTDTFIQRKGERLRFPGEIKEIQVARALRI